MCTLSENIGDYNVTGLGEDTILAMMTHGYAALALGLLHLYAAGYQPGEIFSSKQLIKCGLGRDLANTIVRQCKGQDWDKKTAKRCKKQVITLTREQTALLESARFGLSKREREIDDRLRDPSMVVFETGYAQIDVHELVADFESINTIKKSKYKNLPLINSNRPLGRMPSSKEVQDLFRYYRYRVADDRLNLSTAKANFGGRGPKPIFFYLPEQNEISKLFGIKVKNYAQKHVEIVLPKNKRGLYLEMERVFIERNRGVKISTRRLSGRLGVSIPTIYRIHEELDIVKQNNIFIEPLSEKSIFSDYLVLKKKLGIARGGIWFQAGDWQHKFKTDEKGLEEAKALANKIHKPIYLCGYEANSYDFAN